MRLSLKIALIVVAAGTLPVAAGVGSDSVGLGLAVLALVVLVGVGVARTAEVEMAPLSRLTQEDPAPTPDDPPRPPRLPGELGRVACAIAAELKSPASPALRRFLLYARPPVHRPVPVDINRAVEVCVRAMQAARVGPGGGCSLAFDPDPNLREVPLDTDSFHQLLLNLIRNAQEAAGPSGHVDVRTQAMGDVALVAVRDDGPGVPPEDVEKIFQPFHTTRPNAMGLGLAICRRIAAAHAGSVTAINIHPHGLEVGARLPRRPQ